MAYGSKMDVVYTIKPCTKNEELRYSLRSLENLPHGKVWIYGPELDWIQNVNNIYFEQTSSKKWTNVNSMLRAVCDNPEVSENFIFMNDDFFVLKKIRSLKNYYNGTLQTRLLELRQQQLPNPPSKYMYGLMTAKDELERQGKEILNFEVHMPMVFNKEKLAKILDEHPESVARRSLYGNTYKIGKLLNTKDCKIIATKKSFAETDNFVSTADFSFTVGRVGYRLRRKFPTSCKYEK